MVAPAALSAAGSSVLSILSFLITLRVAGALVRRARLARLRRGALGPLGEVLSPLWPLLVYLPLVASGALPAPADGTAPLVYAALGYLTWSLLVETTLAPARGLAEHVGPGLAPASRMLAGALEAGRRALIRAAVFAAVGRAGARRVAHGTRPAWRVRLPCWFRDWSWPARSVCCWRCGWRRGATVSPGPAPPCVSHCCPVWFCFRCPKPRGRRF